MSLFIISDLHLALFPGGDKPMDVFGPRWHNHVSRLQEAWEEAVSPEDTVILGGDISWALKLEEAKADLDWIDRRPGKKIILKGNHDLWWSGITRLNAMYDGIHFLQNDFVHTEGVYVCGSRGWITPDNDDFGEEDEKIFKRELLRLESSLSAAAKARAAAREKAREEGMEDEAGTDPLIGVLHYPPVSDLRRFSGFQQLFEDYGVGEVYYGHIHGEEGFLSAIQGEHHGIRYQLTSLDFLNCRPLKIR